MAGAENGAPRPFGGRAGPRRRSVRSPKASSPGAGVSGGKVSRKCVKRPTNPPLGSGEGPRAGSTVAEGGRRKAPASDGSSRSRFRKDRAAGLDPAPARMRSSPLCAGADRAGVEPAGGPAVADFACPPIELGSRIKKNQDSDPFLF